MRIFKSFLLLFLTVFLAGLIGLLSLHLLTKNDKIMQKNVEVNIDVKNIINICKTQEDDDLSILF